MSTTNWNHASCCINPTTPCNTPCCSKIHELEADLAASRAREIPSWLNGKFGRHPLPVHDAVLKPKSLEERLKSQTKYISFVFSDKHVSRAHGLMLCAAVFAHADVHTGLPLLTDDGNSLRGKEVLYFKRDDSDQAGPTRIAKNKVPHYLRDLKHRLEPHLGENAALTARLVFAHAVHHVPELVERIQRRILKDPYPPNNRLRNEHQMQQNCVPISLSMESRVSSRSLINILKFLFDRCTSFQTLVDNLQKEKRELQMALYLDGARHTSTAGLVTLSIKLLHPLSPHLTIHSVYSVLPLSILWSRQEDLDELMNAFGPALAEVAQVVRSGIVLKDSPTALTAHSVFCCDQKMSDTLFGANQNVCAHCGVTVTDLKKSVEDPHTQYALGPASLQDLRARVAPPMRVLVDSMQSIFDICPDLLHLTKRVLLSLLGPIFELACENEVVRDAFALHVRTECGIPGFAFNVTANNTVSLPSLDVKRLRKIFSKLSVRSVLPPALLTGTAQHLETTLDESDKLLHALYSKPSDESYLTPMAYKAQSKRAERAFRLTHLGDHMTKYMHTLFHHMHQFLEVHETIHPFSMQACEAMCGRNRRTGRRATMHHDHHVDPLNPEVKKILQNCNKLLYGVAYDHISVLFPRSKSGASGGNEEEDGEDEDEDEGEEEEEDEEEDEENFSALEQAMGSWVPRPNNQAAVAAPAAAVAPAPTPVPALAAAAAAPAPAALMDEPTLVHPGGSVAHRATQASAAGTDPDVPTAPNAAVAASMAAPSTAAAAAKRLRRK